MKLPDKIYLQISDIHNELLDPADRTHCEDRVHDDDVEYILARRVFGDFYDLLDKVVEEIDDTLWVNAGTTAHEALVLLAEKHDKNLADWLQKKLENDC